MVFEKGHEDLAFWGKGNAIAYREEPLYMQKYGEFPFFQPSVSLKSQVFLMSLATETRPCPLSHNWGAAAQNHFVTMALLLLLHSTMAQASTKHVNLL